MAQLGRRMDSNAAVVPGIEKHNKDITMATFIKLCKALQCDIAIIYTKAPTEEK